MIPPTSPTRLWLLLWGVLALSGCAPVQPMGERTDTLVQRRVGSAGFRLDPRVYEDRPLVLTLPRATYGSLTLYVLDEAQERKTKLRLSAGDPRLAPDEALADAPLRVQLLHPSAEGEAPEAGRYLLVITDSEERMHELGFELVRRSRAEGAEEPDEDDADDEDEE